MGLTYKNDILSLEAFQSVIEEMKNTDPVFGKNIEIALRAAVFQNHQAITTACSCELLKIALLEEQRTIQAHSSQYLSITDELTHKKNNLLQFNPIVYNRCMDEIENDMRVFIEERKLLMHAEVEKDSTWHTGITDAVKKGGGAVLNTAIKKINSAQNINSRTIVEKVLEEHFSSLIISEKMSEILDTATGNYQNRWEKEINANVPNVKKILAFSTSDTMKVRFGMNFQPGAPEQILTMGIGSAVVGVTGLAVGWHTFAYAMINVFPPIAVFTALLTVATGVLTNENAIQKRKNDIDEILNRYYQLLLQHLYTEKLSELDGKSISEYIENSGYEIANKTLEKWESRYMGKLNTGHYRKLNESFTTHLLYVNESLHELSN